MTTAYSRVKAELCKDLAAKTGLTLIHTYRLIKSGRRPLDPKVARAWDRVVDRARSRGVVVAGAVSSSCPHSATATGAEVRQ